MFGNHLAVLGGIALTAVVCACEPEPLLKVTSTTDGASGSLRDVITRANNNGAPSQRIEVPPGTYELSLCSADDANAGGDLDITAAGAILLAGTGPDVIIKQTCAGERVLDRHGAGVLTVTGITLTGGNTTEDGGAIRAQRLVLSKVALNANRAREGGAVHARTVTANELTATGNTAAGQGGALRVITDAVLTRSTIGSNEGAVGGGVAVDGKLTMSDTRITANRTSGSTGNPGTGSGLYSTATLGAGVLADTVEGDRVTIDNNYLHTCSFIAIYPRVTNESVGGGIFANTISLTNATVTNNTSLPCSPYNGHPSPVITPARAVGLFGRTVTLEHSTIADNSFTAIALDSRHSLIVETSDGSVLAPLADNGGFVPTRLPSFAGNLVDQIPAADCSVKVDARGKSRPQGANCDIGAVEVDIPPGYGAADLSVAFVNPPASILAGNTATWQVEVSSKGPSTQVASVFTEANGMAEIISATATGGGTCTVGRDWPSVVDCTYAAFAPGARETITFVGQLIPSNDLQNPIFKTRVRDRGLLPPLEDDRAEVTTPITADATLRLELVSAHDQIYMTLFNLGPNQAVGTVDRPIRLIFHPAAGVRIEHAPFPTNGMAGIFDVSTAESGFYFALYIMAFDGPPPAQLGTFELDPGLNRALGPRIVPVFYAPPPVSDAVALRSQK